ncbi:MAG: DUF5696 domain-containing protein [Eubacteriales bacterium]|nr:DUF5696 domain-containing protein [Eubacteriales bacterium]
MGDFIQLKRGDFRVSIDLERAELAIEVGNCPPFVSDREHGPRIYFADGSQVDFDDRFWASAQLHLLRADAESCQLRIDAAAFAMTLSFTVSEARSLEIGIEEVESRGAAIRELRYPGALLFELGEPHLPLDINRGGYSLIPLQQGLLLPLNWPRPWSDPPFDGRIGSSSATLPVFAQCRAAGAGGYRLRVLDYADAAYQIDHDPGRQKTALSIRFFASLGAWSEPMRQRFTFFEAAAPSEIAQQYRVEVLAEDRLKTLRDKRQGRSQLGDLIGAQFIHWSIKRNIRASSRLYCHEQPELNHSLASFESRADALEALHRAGVGHCYVHLDGWAEPGYDNQHPDPYPVCEAAGGIEGLIHFSRRAHAAGDLVGLHDQYRDFYFDAASFDLDEAVMNPDGSHPEHANWAGGRQTYLCAKRARDYVERNFSRLAREGFKPDAAYLDVFTCNEGDECANPRHPMRRYDCYQARKACFEYLVDLGILTSSEEVNDWAMTALDFCHYAPYEFMLKEPGAEKLGLPFSFFNLVYHDAVIIPWMMELHAAEDYMLYAFLNGGAPYLIREAAYPGIDGAFGDAGLIDEDKHRERCQVLAAFHRIIAEAAMLKQEFLNSDGRQLASEFAGGYRVSIDLDRGTLAVEKDKAPWLAYSRAGGFTGLGLEQLIPADS